MKAIVLKDIDLMSNDLIYKKDEIIEVEESIGFATRYVRYFHNGEYETMDWIPKDLVKILE